MSMLILVVSVDKDFRHDSFLSLIITLLYFFLWTCSCLWKLMFWKMLTANRSSWPWAPVLKELLELFDGPGWRGGGGGVFEVLDP